MTFSETSFASFVFNSDGISSFNIQGTQKAGSILKANEIGTTGQVSVIGYFLPLFGVVGGAMFFDEELDASVLLGGVLILFAMTAIARGSIPFRNKRKESDA